MNARAKLDVSIALSDNPRTRPLIEGRVEPEGLRLIPTVIHPSEMFWRQLHFGDFDISEMSLSSLLVAASRGDRRWAAIPVYTMRRFFHTGILVRKDAGIDVPAQLAGRKVGVPEYQQTAAIWCRGALENAFGVPASTIDWFMERGPDRSHGSATGFTPPSGVRLQQITPDTDIGQMLATGKLDATLLYLSDPNLVDRSRLNLSEIARPLFPDPLAEGLRYHLETGLYPINHTVVVRRSLLEKHPWIALNLYSSFLKAAETLSLASQAWTRPALETGLIDASTAVLLERNPMPYGLKASLRELEALASYVHAQGLTSQVVAPDQVFAESTLEL